MTTEIKNLTEKEISKLVKAYRKYKEAEEEFKALKEELTKELVPGVYRGKEGNVTKAHAVNTRIDINALLDDYPEIDETPYIRTSEFDRVNVTLK